MWADKKPRYYISETAKQRKQRAALRQIKFLALRLNDPLMRTVVVFDPPGPAWFPDDLRKPILEAVNLLEHVASWRWASRGDNPRRVVIATARWEIRQSTGRPHDRELRALLDSAFRAVGIPLTIKEEDLKHYIRKETEGRKALMRRARGRDHTPKTILYF